MNRKSLLAIIGGLVAAVALGAVLSMNLPALLSSGGGQLSSTNVANAQQSGDLPTERSAPVFYQIIMPISQTDFDEGATYIPIQVEGTLSSGEPYSQMQYVDGIGAGIKVPTGEFRMHVVSGYINGEGVVHAAPENEVRAKVPVDQDASAPVQALIHIPEELRNDNYVSSEIRERVESLTPRIIEMLEFPVIDTIDVTDEMLDGIISNAKGAPFDEGRAEAAGKKVAELREELVKAKEKADREAREAAERQRVEEQMEAARAEGRAVIENERKRREEEEKKQKDADEEAAKRAAEAITGWWAAGDSSGVLYYFHDGTFELYQEGASSPLSRGTMQVTRLTDDQAMRVGGTGYLVSVGGPQGYVWLDAAPGVLECRNVADLSSVGTGDLSPTVAPTVAPSANPSSQTASAQNAPTNADAAAAGTAGAGDAATGL